MYVKHKIESGEKKKKKKKKKKGGGMKLGKKE